jgi:hypothetical protein
MPFISMADLVLPIFERVANLNDHIGGLGDRRAARSGVFHIASSVFYLRG